MDLPQRPIYPIGAYALSGLAQTQQDLLSLDTVQGYLLKIDPMTGDTQILNSRQTQYFQSATGLALWESDLWIARDSSILKTSLESLTSAQNCQPIKSVIDLPYPANDIAVWKQTVYVTAQKAGRIFVYDAVTCDRITQFRVPGIGIEKIAVSGDYLWLCDQTEQTVYCLDRATGEQLTRILTPFASPTGVAVLPDTTPDQGQLWISYAIEEPYVRDQPNTPDFPYELTFRDRTFIHPLKFERHQDHVLSNGYRLEMIYAEELEPLDEIQLEQLEWRMALPTQTDRQQVIAVHPIPSSNLLRNPVANWRKSHIER